MEKCEMGKVARLLLLTVVSSVIIIVGSTLFDTLVSTCHAQEPDSTPGWAQLLFSPYTSPNERFGFGLAGSISSLTGYDVAQLNAGWYLNWGTALDPPRPAGLVYVQELRLHDAQGRGPPNCLRPCSWLYTCQDTCWMGGAKPADVNAVTVSRDLSTIAEIAQRNPGSVWLIGNEPDRLDYVCPDNYALIYHDLYHYIKDIDPTAKISIGGIVQPTPLRLEYLDIVMYSYQYYFPEEGKLPVDFWNIHAFVLRERRLNLPDSWGCDIPPSIWVDDGELYELWEHDDMDIFKENIRAFRDWMADYGERDKPLVISEYGILMPTWLCDGDPNYSHPNCGTNNGRPYDYSRVTAFMQATFDYFLGIDPDGIDNDLGYPADGNRLVQAWNWYALNDGSDPGYNGYLFSQSTKQITSLGVDFGQYTTSPATMTVPYKELLPWELSFEHTPELFAGDPVTVTLSSYVFNMGNEAADDVPVRFWNGAPGVGTQLGNEQIVSNVPSRYQGAPTAAITWTTVATDVHEIYVQVNPGENITETTYANNTISATLDFKSDLMAKAIAFEPPTPLLEEGQPVTVTISGQVQNVGHLAAVTVTVRFWDGDPDGGGTQIGSDQILAPNPADPLGQDEVATAQVTWTTDVSGTHQIYVRVDPDNTVGEIDEDNNQKMETILVATDRAFFPLIFKESSGVPGTSVSAGSKDFKIRLPTPTLTP